MFITYLHLPPGIYGLVGEERRERGGDTALMMVLAFITLGCGNGAETNHFMRVVSQAYRFSDSLGVHRRKGVWWGQGLSVCTFTKQSLKTKANSPYNKIHPFVFYLIFLLVCFFIIS